MYVLKTRFFLRCVLGSFISYNSSFVYPVDLWFCRFFDEYKKRLFIFYNDLFLKESVKFDQDLSTSSILGINKFAFDFYLSDSFYSHIKLKSKIFNNSKGNLLSFEIFAPIVICLNKLRELGFFNKSKYTPIGNTEFLSYDDYYIINSFSSLAYTYLNWFRCSVNFYSVKILVNLIRESCFLTLCRKHNKSKSWVIGIYSKDLLLLRKFSHVKYIFPSYNALSLMKRKFYNSAKLLFFDEVFFLY
jgi:hypothetical protein